MRIALALLVILLSSFTARATTIDPAAWEELVIGADFVGVVECETAGGIVARYRVVESWKGPPVGSSVTIRVPVDYWEPQYPLTLVGERWVVTAYAGAAAPARVTSTTIGDRVPLWWRDLPADFELPLFQGRAQVRGTRVDTNDAPENDLDRLRAYTKKLVTASPEVREQILYRVLVKRVFPTDSKLHQMGLPSLIGVLLKRGMEPDGGHSRRLLERAGGPATLAALGRVQAPTLTALVAPIRARLTGVKPAAAPPRAPKPPPTETELADLRKLFAGTPTNEAYQIAFPVLTAHDPALIAKHFAAWTNPQRGWGPERGYVLGSYFGWKCGGNRQQHLQALAGAQDPFVRVAAAVYLAFEDERAGMVRLTELAKLTGDPGTWAALTLARRGDKRAVPRLLEVFATDGDSGMHGVPHRNLQKRARELLSNSAAASGLPQPQANDHQAWWKQHAAKVTLHDPWLPALAKLKVD